MSVIRVVHNQENPFVQLNKKALWDINLSLKAVGLWARCMSRPDNWTFNVKELVKKSKEGRRAIDAAIHELIDQNYAIKLEHWEKDEDGKFSNGGIEYVFFEFPATQEDKDKVLQEFKKSFRNCGFSNRRSSDSQNAHLLIKKDTDIDLGIEKEEASPSAPSDPPPPIQKKLKEEKTEVSPSVKLTKKQISDLLRRLEGNESKMKLCFDKLSAWKIGKGKIGGNDYLSIIRWVIKAVEEEIERTPSLESKQREFKNKNILLTREAQSQLRKKEHPISKEIFISEQEVVRLDNGKRISLYLEPQDFKNKFLETFEIWMKHNES